MKYLQRLCLLLTVSVTIFSCQKEYSVENSVPGSNPDAQWSFSEGSARFKGPIDTVSIDTVGTIGTPGAVQILSINGHSDDKKDLINLEILGTDLKVGTYKTPYCLFAYARNGIVLYQTNQTAVDSFTIVISKLDSTGITGTFSGKAWDSSKTYKAIVDGKFSSVFKPSTGVTPPASSDSGQVVLWSKAGCGGGTSTTPINVTVSNKSGLIRKFVAAEPSSCDSTVGFSVKLPVGNYTWVAKCGTDSVKGTVIVTKGGCSKAQVDFTIPVLTGDYFPLTTNSNWSYAYDSGGPGDTLYTLSTGKTLTALGNTYNMFTDADASGKDSIYYRKSGNSYYQYVPASSYTDSGLTFTTPATEFKFLVDNLAAGATWQSAAVINVTQGAIPVGTINATIKSTILATAASSGTYTNVIKVKNVYSYVISGVSTDQYVEEQWYSKGTGLIKYVYYQNDPTFTVPDFTQSITRAKVY